MAELLLALQIGSAALDLWAKVPPLSMARREPSAIVMTTCRSPLPFPDDPPSDYYDHARQQQVYYSKMINGK